MRRAFGLAFLLLTACGGDDGGATGPQGDATVHVDHYDFTFDLATRAAVSHLDYTFTADGNCVSLPDRATAVDDTAFRVDGQAVTGTFTDDGKLALCGPGHAAGDTGSLEAAATIPLARLGASQVGYSVTPDKTPAKNPFTYMVSWVDGCDQFGPCDNRPDQFATYTFHVAHDASVAVRCSGTITEPSDTETDCDFALPGGPTYSTFGFAAYPRAAWTPSDLGMWGSAHVTLDDRTDTGIAARIDPAYHAGFIAWMESTFGPYPFGADLRFVVAPTFWAGFEHPGNIVLDDGLADEPTTYLADPVAHTIDHEMTHQWAGDQTTLADTYDFVWKESMAEYLAFVWEDMNDHAVGLATARGWKAQSEGSLYYPVPEDKPRLFAYYGDVYGPGPLILFRQLEVLAGRDKVIAALQTVLGAPRALSVDEVVAALAASTGLDLTGYAAAWIRGTGAPTTPVITAQYADGKLHITQSGDLARRCKFHVALAGAGPTDQLLVEVDTFHDGTEQMIDAAPAFSVVTTTVDPDAECLVSGATP